MDRSPVRDFIVGLFLLVGLAAVAYLSIQIGGFGASKGGLVLWAKFNETGDLAVHAPVVIAGVRIGEITRIDLDADDFRARVEMNMDAKVKLPTDTTASIVTAGMLGDRYIELSPGGDDKILKSGDQLTFTESAVILEKLIGQVVYSLTKGDNNKENKPAAAPATEHK